MGVKIGNFFEGGDVGEMDVGRWMGTEDILGEFGDGKDFGWLVLWYHFKSFKKDSVEAAFRKLWVN